MAAANQHSDTETPQGPPLRLIFMGTPAYAAVSLRFLLGLRHPVVAVVTRPDRPSGRGQRLHACAVKELALAHGLEVLDPPSPRDPLLARRLAELAPDLGVVVAYGRILPLSVLDIPRLGCINAHGSLLPRLRGAAPIERAILTGERGTGVTIMQMNERMDEGDILRQASVPLEPHADAPALREELAALSAKLFEATIEDLASGRATRTPQEHARATYAPPIEKSEAAIDWREPAEAIDRKVRAFAPQPGAFTFDAGRRLKILAARPQLEDLPDGAAPGESPRLEPGAVVATTTEGLIVECGRGRLLLTRVQPEGRAAMAAVDYARGCRDLAPQRRLHG